MLINFSEKLNLSYLGIFCPFHSLCLDFTLQMWTIFRKIKYQCQQKLGLLRKKQTLHKPKTKHTFCFTLPRNTRTRSLTKCSIAFNSHHRITASHSLFLLCPSRSVYNMPVTKTHATPRAKLKDLTPEGSLQSRQIS